MLGRKNTFRRSESIKSEICDFVALPPRRVMPRDRLETLLDGRGVYDLFLLRFTATLNFKGKRNEFT
jgi:hypothetical protein